MSLRDAIEGLGKARILKPRVLPAVPYVAAAATKLEQRFGTPRPLGPEDREALVKKLHAVASSGDWSAVLPRDLRQAADCLFEGGQPLAQNRQFLSGYLGALSSLGSRSAVNRLIYAYLANFSLGSTVTKEIGVFLSQAVGRWSWNWALRHREHQVFDAAQAPTRLAEVVLGSDDPCAALAEVGLKGQLGNQGLASAIFRDTLTSLRRRLERKAALADVNRIIAWARGPDGGLVFDSERSAIADAFLLPWERRDPPADIRRVVERFLLETFKDPRIHPAQWAPVEDATRAVMTRWLAQATLEQFLRVVDRVAPNQQWEFRRAFWGAFIELGYVRDAWVCFASAGTDVARQIARESNDQGMLRFAMLAGQCQPNHAVLLLRIGDLVVADWSHNGKVRIWIAGHKNVPGFYQRNYYAQDLRAPCNFEKRHYPQGPWQDEARGYIERHTGVRLKRIDYMPKGWRG